MIALTVLCVDLVLASLYVYTSLPRSSGTSSGTLPGTSSGPQGASPDVIVALMNSFNRDYSGLGEETLRRVDYAADLLEREAQAKALCMGGYRASKRAYGSVYMKNALVARGIAPERVSVEKRSNTTRSNLRQLHALALERQWERLVIVSSPLHLRRIRGMLDDFSADGIEVRLAPYDMSTARPKISVLGVYVDVHYEWSVTMLDALPDVVYRTLVTWLRS